MNFDMVSCRRCLFSLSQTLSQRCDHVSGATVVCIVWVSIIKVILLIITLGGGGVFCILNAVIVGCSTL